jgi:hypothetical protein
MALAIAVANPVVMIHLIGGAHNDALMMGLLLVGLASWERGRKLLAVALVTLALCVKLPAGAASTRPWPSPSPSPTPWSCSTSSAAPTTTRS